MNDKLLEAIQTQMIEEVGAEKWEEMLPPDEMDMLMQKWGVKIPRLIQSEMYLIHREEQRARDQRIRREWR
jgi:hypothetical protein